MKLKKGIKKTGKIIVILAIILVILVIGFLAYKRFFKTDNTKKKVEIADKIDDYNYVLEENATSLYKKLFKELRNTLNAKEVDEEKYASLVAELLVADFYNLDDKI